MSKRKIKICLITPGHISTNPRLIKEAITLDRFGYDVHIIFTQYIEHWSAIDKKLLEANPNLRYTCLNWENNGIWKKSIRYGSGLLNKTGKYFFERATLTENIAINRHFYWQLNASIMVKAELYIAHNLAALPVAFHASKKLKVKYGFDAEDFHRFEESDDQDDKNVILKKHIEQKYIPQLDYISAASPLIANEYKKLFPKLCPVSILNVFPLMDIQVQKRKKETIKLFWFSQWVGKGRGLEEVIAAIGSLPQRDIELHILGDTFGNDKKFFDQLISGQNLAADKIKFYPTIHPDEIIAFAAQFDIGLATEISQPYNRDICLTNKIFTYLQSGLCIVASNTSAQKDFIGKYPSLGKLYKKGDYKDLAAVIEFAIDNPNWISETKEQARRISETQFNWEMEEKKFISIINNLVQKPL